MKQILQRLPLLISLFCSVSIFAQNPADLFTWFEGATSPGALLPEDHTVYPLMGIYGRVPSDVTLEIPGSYTVDTYQIKGEEGETLEKDLTLLSNSSKRVRVIGPGVPGGSTTKNIGAMYSTTPGVFPTEFNRETGRQECIGLKVGFYSYETIKEPGTYILEFPEGAFYLNGEPNEAFELEIIVKDQRVFQPIPLDFEIDSKPNTLLEKLIEPRLRLNNYEETSDGGWKEKYTSKGIAPQMYATISKDGGERRNCTVSNPGGSISTLNWLVQIDPENNNVITEPGTYRLEIPQGIIRLEDNETGLLICNQPLCYEFVVGSYTNNLVIEMFTGLVSGYDVRGYAGLEYMHETHPDSAILVSVHNYGSDPMLCESYSPWVSKYITGSPQATINRLKINPEEAYYNSGYNCDPSKLNLIEAYTMYGNKPCAAKIEVEGDYSEGNDEEVIMIVRSIFNRSFYAHDYALAFVLTEDNLGPYNQINFYSGGKLGECEGFENESSTVSLMFNNVARNIWHWDGLSGSLPSSIEAGNEYEYTFNMDISNVEDHRNAHLIALLIDKETGEIITGGRNIITNAKAPESVIHPATLLGDANGNGEVNIADAVHIANYAVGNVPENFNIKAADVNGDGNITLSDASATIGIILDQPVDESDDTQRRPAAEASNYVVVRSLNNGKSNNSEYEFDLLPDNGRNYVAVQGVINIPEGLSVERIETGEATANHVLTTKALGNGLIRFALFNPDCRTFGEGDETLLKIRLNGVADSDAVTISNIIAADCDGAEYRLGSASTEGSLNTGINSYQSAEIRVNVCGNLLTICGASGMEVTVYSVDGCERARFIGEEGENTIQLSSGAYLVKTGTSVHKVIVK